MPNFSSTWATSSPSPSAKTRTASAEVSRRHSERPVYPPAFFVPGYRRSDLTFGPMVGFTGSPIFVTNADSEGVNALHEYELRNGDVSHRDTTFLPGGLTAFNLNGDQLGYAQDDEIVYFSEFGATAQRLGENSR